MKRATLHRVLAVAAASGAVAVAVPASAVFAADGADAGSTAAGSPGVLSGNNIQVPVSVPLNLCGNTVDVVGLLNPAVGNVCKNKDGVKADGAETHAGPDWSGESSAHGRVTDSPGLISGNGIHLPVDLPLNISGNSVNGVGVGNPVIGNHSVNDSGISRPHVPRQTPAPKPSQPRTPRHQAVPYIPDTAAPTLAHTGADQAAPAVAASAAFLLAGAILYRRFRPGR